MVIIDASVAVKWFVEENDSDFAIMLLDQILTSPKRFAVPELFYYEIHSVLSRILEADFNHISKVVERLLVSGLPRFAMNPELWKSTTHFLKFGLSSYDASYAGLAQYLSGRWITADAKAHRLLKKENISLLLSEMKG